MSFRRIVIVNLLLDVLVTANQTTPVIQPTMEYAKTEDQVALVNTTSQSAPSKSPEKWTTNTSSSMDSRKCTLHWSPSYVDTYLPFYPNIFFLWHFQF